MCTSVALTATDFYFGRTLDLECGFNQQVVVTPRAYPFPLRCGGEMRSHYAMIGMANVAEGYPLYAEAANEKGLCMAGLNFPEYTYYPPEKAENKQNIAPFELIPWLLGQCATVDEAKALLARTQVVAVNFSEKIPLSPLHWHIANKHASIVLECVREGMRIYDNPAHVMTNSPTFDFHMTNLRQYMGLTHRQVENTFSSSMQLTPMGRAWGSLGLPGDATPISRFVRAAYLVHNSVCEGDEVSRVSHFFRILDSVSLTKGSVMTEGGQWDYTQYTCCINADKGIYYYKTYDQPQLTAVHLHHEDLEGSALAVYPLVKRQEIFSAN